MGTGSFGVVFQVLAVDRASLKEFVSVRLLRLFTENI